MLKENVLARIKAKFPDVKNLSTKRLEAILKILKLGEDADEATIDTRLDAFNEFNPIADLAKQDDMLRDLQGKLKKAETPKPAATRNKDTEEGAEDNPESEKESLPDDTPAWAKALVKQNQKLASDVKALREKEHEQTLAQQAAKLLKDVPASFWKKRGLPKKEEDLEAFAEEVKEDWNILKQEAKIPDTNEDAEAETTYSHPAPKVPGGTPGAGNGKADGKVSPEIKKLYEQKKNRENSTTKQS